jgi:hypothetical protein
LLKIRHRTLCDQSTFVYHGDSGSKFRDFG